MKRKNTLKSVLATLLLIAIVLLSIPKFAANPEVGSITLKQIEQGARVTIYQIATFNYNYETNQPIFPTYKWNSKVDTWLIGSEYSIYAGDSGADKFGQAGENVVKEVYGAITAAIRTEGEVDIDAFKTAEATEETLTIENLPIGTYIIIVEDAKRIYQPIVRNIGMEYSETNSVWQVINAEVSVDVKSKTISIEKTANSNNYKTTEDIQYNIKADIPAYPANAISTVYKIADKLPQEIAINTQTIEVYGQTAMDVENGQQGTKLTLGTDYTINTTETEKYTFMIDFADYSKISNFAKIQVSYKAKIKPDANTAINKELKNAAYLEYSNNPYEENNYKEKEEKTEEIVKTYGFTVNKVDGSRGNTPLAGAKFTVYAQDRTTKLSFRETASGIYYYDKESDVAELEVNSEGKLEVRGLDVGTYYLEETKAPNGFNKLSEIKEIVVNENEDAKVYEIENKKGFILPLTGGMGTIAFIVVGIAFIVFGAVILIIINKKKNNKEE